jgi:hypothetical protein
MIMYLVVGIDPTDEVEDPPVCNSVYATEDGAYAALGRLAVHRGAVADMAVQEVQVVFPSQVPGMPEVGPVPDNGRPKWLDDKVPGPWVRRGDDIETAHGGHIMNICLSGLTGAEDQDLAEYIVRLVNGDKQ